MTTTPRIYLAGPDVFLPQAATLAAAKQQICAQLGLVGLHPMDNELDASTHSPSALGYAIAAANEELMRSCDAVIANLTPWNGPSADAGTVYELGFMRALGRPCFAYSNDRRTYIARLQDYMDSHQLGPITTDQAGHMHNRLGHKLENFDLADNAMLPGGIMQSGGVFALGHLLPSDADYLTDLSAFQQAAQACAAYYQKRGPL